MQDFFSSKMYHDEIGITAEMSQKASVIQANCPQSRPLGGSDSSASCILQPELVSCSPHEEIRSIHPYFSHTLSLLQGQNYSFHNFSSFPEF